MLTHIGRRPEGNEFGYTKTMFDCGNYSCGTISTETSNEYYRETREKKAIETGLKFACVGFVHAVAPFMHKTKSLGFTKSILVLTYICVKRQAL